MHPVFLSPLPLEGCQTRSISARQDPDCGKKGFKAEFAIPFVEDLRISAEQIKLRMQEIVQIGSDSGFPIPHCHDQMIRIFEPAALIEQLHRRVGRKQFQTRNGMIARPVGGILQSLLADSLEIVRTAEK